MFGKRTTLLRNHIHTRLSVLILTPFRKQANRNVSINLPTEASEKATAAWSDTATRRPPERRAQLGIARDDFDRGVKLRAIRIRLIHQCGDLQVELSNRPLQANARLLCVVEKDCLKAVGRLGVPS